MQKVLHAKWSKLLSSVVPASPVDAGGWLRGIVWQLLPDALIAHQTYYCFAPKTHLHLLRNNLFFALHLLQSPITHICRVAPTLWFSDLFSSDQNSYATQYYKKNLERKDSSYDTWNLHISEAEIYWQLFDKLIKTKLRSSPTWGAWSCSKPATVRAENSPEAETRRSYFQTGPDVMTGSNLNTGKSVQICQKRESSSCKGSASKWAKGGWCWKWKRIKPKSRSRDRNSLFQLDCPEPFQTIAFLAMSQSEPQKPQQFSPQFCTMKECPGPFIGRKSFKEGHLYMYLKI